MRAKTELIRWFAMTLPVMVALAVPANLVQGATVPTAQQVRARQILDKTGIKGGFVVHLGCGDGQLTSAFRASDSYQVHGLAHNAATVATARKNIQSYGIYGDVAVDQLYGNRLPYTENLINLVVSEDLGNVPMAEVMRVLAPQGVAYIKRGDEWTATIKPRPADIDEWTHYMHGPDGNTVAHDDQVGPPAHLQWVGSPRWSRHHDRMASMSAMVSAGGRVYYIMDEGSRVSIQMPSKWMLVARDAFNGTILWKQSMGKWHHHLWPLKSGPTQLARKLVAVGDKVFVTLGINAPVVMLDGATGEVLRTFEGSATAEEFIVSNDTLYVMVNPNPSELAEYAPAFNTGDQARVAREFHWDENPRIIKAYQAGDANLMWVKDSRVSPLTLSSAQEHVFFHDGEKIVCLDRDSGSEVWTSPPASRREKVEFNFGPRLVLYEDVVLYAGGDRAMSAYEMTTGEQLWSADHGSSGYRSPEDLLVSGGLVWATENTSGNMSGVYTGRDPRTGAVINEFPPDVDTYWFHHRCYIGKATDKFLMPSRTGIEFVDHNTQHWDINHWVRGGCLYGVMPCNGMTYAPPHDCACYPEAKLYGLNALVASNPSRLPPVVVPDAERFERGPAYGAAIETAAKATDWPTFRHDNVRSGRTTIPVSAELDTSPAWKNSLGGRLSSVVVAGGKLFVAQIDAHTLHAIDADSGKTAWSYTTGGRIDSPPTIYEGRALFGSADGWVYCLRASDGELIWRFRAAPEDRRLTAFEQLESVWPVHGNVLVHDGMAYFVAGRSYFLDGGMRFFKLNPKTGEKLAEVVLDQRDPETGSDDIQDRLQILNMPVALPDILSADSRYIYMRSQKFDVTGKREDLGPNSGQPAEQTREQTGDSAHLFSPTGFLDDSWFHRAYWVYGRAFAGGHSGYHQAGKFAPAGRLLVFDDQQVYGFGREPEYLKWTTTMEHRLFSTSKDFELVREEVSIGPNANAQARRRAAANRVQYPRTDWKHHVPLLVRGLVMADDTLFMAGPPDLVDEEESFKRIMAGDSTVWAELDEQDAALKGTQGAVMLAVSATDGEQKAEYKLDSLPVWDGLVAAGGRLYMATTDGDVICIKER